ncbi:MAG: HAD hydrolase family protein [Flammeovirgaceae bacterium]|tara:strand:+ start:7152 stop:7661 length:510 start_codon:yes stop_codon:yes gene_type:complete
MKKIKNFIFDVDGVLTDGKFYYTNQGKIMKIFGDADNDALSILSKYCHIEMVTGDKRGFDISKKRVEEDMGYKISLVSTFDRLKWISKRFDLEQTVYMGDGIFDPLVFRGVNYSICPNNGFYNTKKYADYVTKSNGSEGAVAEAILHVLDKFFKVDNILNLKIIKSGNW